MVAAGRHGVARVLSKRGLASRTEAARWVREGRVKVDGKTISDPDHPTAADARIDVDGAAAGEVERVHIALNKPRGLVTTASDERGRATVYDCLSGLDLPWLAPVGRLDQASEGLLLLSNDPEWAARITDPMWALCKTYHVQVRGLPSMARIDTLVTGVAVDSSSPPWQARAARLLRSGGKTAWLEIVLDEGRNRQIRRMLEAMDLPVLRLLRVAIGTVHLGDLAKGAVRRLGADEVTALGSDPDAPRGAHRANP